MVVGALVRSAHNRNHQVGVLPNLGVSNRRLQKMTMFLNPSLEIKRGQFRHDVLSLANPWANLPSTAKGKSGI